MIYNDMRLCIRVTVCDELADTYRTLYNISIIKVSFLNEEDKMNKILAEYNYYRSRRSVRVCGGSVV